MIPTTILREAQIELAEAVDDFKSKSQGLGADFLKRRPGYGSNRMARM